MDEKKRLKLEADGWVVAGPREFINLSEEEMEAVEKPRSQVPNPVVTLDASPLEPQGGQTNFDCSRV